MGSIHAGSAPSFGNDLKVFLKKIIFTLDLPRSLELDQVREWATKTVGHFHNISGQID